MPADPPHSPARSAPERDPYEADEADEAAEAGDLASLKKREDVPGILALAKAFRAGTAPGGRDLKQCLEAYRAAAELGSAEAEYAVALFHMNGGSVVTQDLKEGTMRLRSAAEKGSVPAKVYLGNLYELGIHYKADAEKADVWYRNAGRGARIEAEQGSDAWNRALADLGCARHVLELANDPATSEEDKTRLLARAKAHGHGLRIRDREDDSGDRATFVDALAASAGSERVPATATPPPVAMSVPLGEKDLRAQKETSPETLKAKQRVEERGKAAAATTAPVSPAAKAAAEKAEKAAKKKAAEKSARISAGLAAFGYALLFMLAGTAAGYAATLGARELVAHGQVLPLVGTKTRLVFPIVLGIVGVLPAWLVYRLGTVAKAILAGAVFAGLGWVAWGTGKGVFHPDRPLQALAFAAVGFLAGLLALGLNGGTKQRRT